ncbi:hypothetical protein WDM22_00680 [Bradyrhizobium septentrionale]|uniref:hypothetical protein n=1 Tax=Bradyrhizobium septentrionale TaxID=1404411 RepID=UPI0030D3D1DD
MRNLLAQYARSVPGALEDAWTDGDDMDVMRVGVAISNELRLIESQDRDSREREADRAKRQLTEEQLIWGGAMPQLVGRNSGGAA